MIQQKGSLSRPDKRRCVWSHLNLTGSTTCWHASFSVWTFPNAGHLCEDWCLFFLLPLFLELVSAASSSSAFCSASSTANCNAWRKNKCKATALLINLFYHVKWQYKVFLGNNTQVKRENHLIKDRFELPESSLGKIKAIFT